MRQKSRWQLQRFWKHLDLREYNRERDPNTLGVELTWISQSQWEHDALTDIVDTLGDDSAPEYPDDRCVLHVWQWWAASTLTNTFTASTSL